MFEAVPSRPFYRADSQSWRQGAAASLRQFTLSERGRPMGWVFIWAIIRAGAIASVAGWALHQDLSIGLSWTFKLSDALIAFFGAMLAMPWTKKEVERHYRFYTK